MNDAVLFVPKIFLSYSHDDAIWCTPFVTQLQGALGVTDPGHIFYDTDSLRIGDEWLTRISQEIISRPIFMVVLSRKSITSDYVRQETSLALRLAGDDPERRIVPIMIDNCNPNDLNGFLLDYQVADFVQLPYRTAFERLVKSLHVAPSATHTSERQEKGSEDRQGLKAIASLIHDVHQARLNEQWNDAILKAHFAMQFPEAGNYPDLQADIALSHAGLGHWQQVLDSALAALKLDVFRGDVWRALALAYSRLGHTMKAIDAFDHARAVTPLTDKSMHLKLLGERRAVLVDQRSWTQALDTLDQELFLVPDDAARRVIRQQLLRNVGLRPGVVHTQHQATLNRLPSLQMRGQWPTIMITEGGRELHSQGAMPLSSTRQSRRLPIYVLVDLSSAMTNERLETVVRSLGQLRNEIVSNPGSARASEISVILFSHTAIQFEFIPITQFHTSYIQRDAINTSPKHTSLVSSARSVVERWVPFLSRPPCALGGALRILNASLRQDIIPNKAQFLGDHSPLILIFLAGHPTDGWKPEVVQLQIETIAKPAVIGFGFGNATDTLAMVCQYTTHLGGGWNWSITRWIHKFGEEELKVDNDATGALSIDDVADLAHRLTFHQSRPLLGRSDTTE